MVKLRLQRFGKTKAPFYRVVATDSHNPRDGRFIEIVGTYNPLTNPATVTFEEEKVLNLPDRSIPMNADYAEFKNWLMENL